MALVLSTCTQQGQDSSASEDAMPIFTKHGLGGKHSGDERHLRGQRTLAEADVRERVAPRRRGFEGGSRWGRPLAERARGAPAVGRDAAAKCVWGERAPPRSP